MIFYRLFKLTMIGCLVLALLALVGGTALWHQLGSDVLGGHHPGLSVSVNGDDVDIQSFAGLDWLGSVIGVFVAGLVLCLVVPLLLLLGLGLPLLIVGGVLCCILAALLSAGAVVFSPFVLFVLFIVWAVRRKPRATPPANRPNIAP